MMKLGEFRPMILYRGMYTSSIYAFYGMVGLAF